MEFLLTSLMDDILSRNRSILIWGSDNKCYKGKTKVTRPVRVLKFKNKFADNLSYYLTLKIDLYLKKFCFGIL